MRGYRPSIREYLTAIARYLRRDIYTDQILDTQDTVFGVKITLELNVIQGEQVIEVKMNSNCEVVSITLLDTARCLMIPRQDNQIARTVQYDD